MPIDAFYNAIRNAPNQQGWQAAQQREAASYQAAIDEAVAREQAAQQAQQLWNGYDYNAEAERRAQVGGFDATTATQQVDPLVQAMYYAQQNIPNGRWQADPQQMSQQYAMLPGTDVPVNSARGQAMQAVDLQAGAAKAVQDAIDPFAFSNTTPGILGTKDRTRAYTTAGEILRSADATKQQIADYNTDADFANAQEAQQKAVDDYRRQQATSETEAGNQLAELYRQRDELQKLIGMTSSAFRNSQGQALNRARQEQLARINAQIRQYEADVAAVEKNRLLNEYAKNEYNADFRENSQYRKTYGDEAVQSYGLGALFGGTGENKFVDIDDNARLYELINGNSEIKEQRLQDTQNAGEAASAAIVNAADPLQVVKYMSDREKALFNYIYNTQGGDAARQYYDLLVADLNARYNVAETQRWAKEAKEHPLGASIASVAASPMKGLTLVGQTADMLSGEGIDSNAPYNTFSNMPTAVRSQVAHDIERNYGKAGSFAYNTAMSMADNLWQMAITGGEPGQNLMLAIMGSGAAADSVRAAKTRGLSDGQAYALGLASGAIEALTEKIGLDALYEGIRGGKTALRAMLNSTLAEGSEEVLGTFLDDIADMIIAGTDSERMRRIAELKAQGMSDSEAAGRAYVELLKEAGVAGLSGALSGLLMSGGAQTIMRGYNSARSASGPTNIFSQQYNENALDEAYRNPNEDHQWQYGSDILAEQERQERRARAEERRNAKAAQTAAVPSETPVNPAVSAPTAPQTATDTATQTAQETPVQNGDTTPPPKTPAPQADRVTYKTGEGTTVTAFHGKGKTRAEIYAWAQTPIAGEGAYYALTEKRAKQYGDDVTASEVTVKNPLVINDDTDWINLIREAGWRNANPYGADSEEVAKMTSRLKDVILSKGHDSLIVQYEKHRDGDMNSKTRGWVKTLDDVFGHDQIVVYDTASNTQTVPAQTAPATNTARSLQSGEVQASADADRTTWENWKTERAEGNTAEAKPLSALIEEMRTFFGLHVGIGNVRTPRANATYNTRDHDIRTRIANNVPSISHELGHHIDQLHGITRNASAEVQADLDAAYSREFADDTYAQREHASEGLAQFIKYYLTNSEQAVSDFPNLANAFLSSLTEQERSFINSFADEVNAYMSTAVEDRPSSVVLPGEKNDTRSTREKVSQATDRFIQNWTDRFHGIKRAEAKLGGDGTVYQTVQGLPYARNVADYCLTKEMTDLNGQRVGGSLVSALEGINVENKAEFRAFGDYLVEKHLPERLAQGKRVYADEQRNRVEAAQKRIAQLDAKYPQFKAAAERVVGYERQLVKTFGVDAGLISADTFKHWQEIYPNHVPLNRVMDETGSYGAKRGGEVDSAFKMTAKDGSGRDIVHPVMNIINETISLVQLAKENQVRLGLRELAMGQDANAAVMTKVNPMKAETVRADELKDAVRKTARTLAGIVDESNIDRLLDELQDYTIFRKGKGGGNEVPVMVDGNAETWQINDPLLLDSLNNMRPQKMSAILETYGKISRFITQNITGGDIVWSISRNMPKDQINLLMLMKDKKQLLNVIKNEGVSWANSFLEARGKTEQMNPFVREFYAMGGGRGQSALTQGSDFTRSTARALTGQNKSAKGIAEKILTSPMDLVGFVSDMIETGPRCATYVSYRQNGYSPQRAFYEAMDSTTNFAMQGKLGREVNKVVPFFSAGIAGVNRMVRYLSAEDVAGQGKEARKRAVASRVTTYVVTSFLLTAIQFALNHATKKREEEYQRVSNYIKNTNWLIPYGDGKFVAIQKSRETNLLSSFFDALLERTVGGDEHAFDEFYGYAVDQVFPGVASDLAKLPENIAKDGFGQGIEDSFFSALGSMGLLGVVANLGANKDFRGRPIVSQTYENLPQREQYNASTSKLAYWIGQAFNISPMKLDYFGKNVLGYMWKYPAQVFPMDPSKRDFSLGVKGTYVKDNVYSNDITNRLYDRADASALAAASYSAGPEQKYYKAKDERMTSFYSRFNKLNRDDSSDTARDDRAEMMDFLSAYLAGAEMGEETKAEQFIREACVENEDTKYLPSALPTVIKDGKKEIQLTAPQYFYYQTRYMELYYSKVASRGSLNMNAKRKAEICSAASQEAKEQAAKETLRRR